MRRVNGTNMNGFDVRALGWVVTRDILCEMARAVVGNGTKMPPTMVRELGEHWRAVQFSLGVSRSRRSGMSAIVPLAAPLSEAGEMAIAAFVERLAAYRPDLYGEPALRSRWMNGMAAFIVSASASAVLAVLVPSDTPIIGEAALALLIIAGWKAITTVQLWRTHRMAERIARYPSRSFRTPASR